MKATALLYAAGVFAAGAATSMAQTAYSVNTVGVVSVHPSNGNYVCISNPLTNTSVANTLGNLLGTNLPVNGKVLKWNYAAVHFDIYTRVVFGNGWIPTTAPMATLKPGEGFFVLSPTQITNTFVGDVLDARYYGIQTNSLRSGFELVGSKQPLTGTVFDLGFNIPLGLSPQNQILKWNVGSQRYDIYNRCDCGGHYWLPSIPIINVGEGFFTHLDFPYTWVQNFTVQ